MEFIVSYLGAYFIQTTLDSLIVAIVIEALIKIWNVRRPAAKVRFRLLVLLLPLLLWIGYQLLFPLRNSSTFQDTALFNSQGWLQLGLWDNLRLWYLIAFVFALTAVLFIVQEIVPTVRHWFCRKDPSQRTDEEQWDTVESALKRVYEDSGRRFSKIQILDEDQPLAYTSGIRNHTLVLSTSLLRILDREELKAVVAHETAHMVNQDNWLSWLLLVLRGLMFYNPVALFTFRRVLHETEKECDDWAIKVIDQPLDLASGLLKVFRTARANSPIGGLNGVRGWLASRAAILEDHAHWSMIEDRVKRILNPEPVIGLTLEYVRLSTTAVGLVLLLYFVV